MPDLREDFTMLVEESCEVGFPECQALLDLPVVRSLAGGNPTKDQKIYALRNFLRAAVGHGVEHAPPDQGQRRRTGQQPSQRDIIRAAAAIIGLDPWRGKRKGVRQDAAGIKLGHDDGGSARRPYWREQFITTLVLVVTDFIDDEVALAEFIKENPSTKQAAAEPTSLRPSAVYDDQRPSLQSTYVRRPVLEARFRSVVEELDKFDVGVKVIVLVGQAGMGKTWLAEELTRDMATGNPAEFRDIHDPDTTWRVRASSKEAPPFIVLDNLDNADELKNLLPRHTRSIIVATCRRKGESPAKYRFIDVDRMVRHEAKDMIDLELPGLSDNDKDCLAETFGDYPLIISHVCSVFPNQAASMTMFCQQVMDDAQKFASEVETWDASILLTILRRTINLIEHRNRDAIELLVLMSFMHHRVNRLLLATCFRHFISNNSAANTRFAYAVRTLKSFSLIRCDQEQASYIPYHEYYALHPFTQEVLRREFGSRLEEAFSLVKRVQNLILNGIPAPISEDELAAMRNDGWLYMDPGELIWEFSANNNAAFQCWLRQNNIDLDSMTDDEKYVFFRDLIRRIDGY